MAKAGAEKRTTANARTTDGLDVAPKLKALREQRQLSLRELARQTGVAVSFLSGLEKRRNNVSIATLKTILDALGSSLGEFFNQTPPPPTKVVFHPSELGEISGQEKGISFRDVAGGRAGRLFQLIVERYEPGADTGTYRHGIQEAGIVLTGTLELTVDGTVYVLNPGDSYFFESRRPHRFRNLGKTTVEAISVNSPPSF